MTGAKFAIGDRVTAVAFVDCFGRNVPERNDLTVSDIRKVGTGGAYYRIKATGSGLSYVEAAESFFKAS